MKRTLLALIAAMLTTVMVSGCIWVRDHDHYYDRRGDHGDRYDGHGQSHGHDRDRDGGRYGGGYGH